MADRPERMEVKIEDAKIIFRNFVGAESQYNRQGDRNFGVILDPETAEQMIADGWNVKLREPKDEGDEPWYFIPVAVSFKNYPPKIVMISGKRRTFLNEGTVEVLDYADIALVDLIFNSYSWAAAGKTGIKAYLKTMFVTVNEDDLEKKYALADDPAAHTEGD